MSLLGSINLASNALRATQIGLQVIGQNIANVNTPGYVREEVIFSPAPTQRLGNLLLGLGVEVRGVVQRVDRFLEERLRAAGSDRASAQTQQQVFQQLEGLIGELSETDLSTSLTSFMASINEVLNQPESVSVRNLAVLEGRNLAANTARLGVRVDELRRAQNQQIESAAKDINRLLEDALNVQIAAAEGSDFLESDAVGLRDQRSKALAELSEIVGIRVEEQVGGAVNVFVEGDFLVFGGIARKVELAYASDRGLTVAEVRIAETDTPLGATSGKLAGLRMARDDILGGFLDRLDEFAGTLAFEFNKLFSSGQGLRGYQELVSAASVDDSAAPLDAAGLDFAPVNGSFQVQVFDRQTGLVETTDIFVPLTGLDGDMTLADLAAALDAVDGIRASITPTRELTIESESSTQEFAFADDSSGVLAALGLATFFTGSSARDLGVQAALVADPAKFAASRSGIGAGTGNAVLLAGFLDRPLESIDGQTLSVLYDRLTGETAEASAAASSLAEGFQVFEENLLAQHMAISGVSLDEEAVRLMAYQRSFQAAARYIATLNELLDELLNL